MLYLPRALVSIGAQPRPKLVFRVFLLSFEVIPQGRPSGPYTYTVRNAQQDDTTPAARKLSVIHNYKPLTRYRHATPKRSGVEHITTLLVHTNLARIIFLCGIFAVLNIEHDLILIAREHFKIHLSRDFAISMA